MVSVLFLTYQLSCGMRYLILSVPLSLLALKETRGSHFVQRLFFLINISLNSVYLVMHLYVLCILAVNVMSPLGMHVVSVLPFVGRMRTLCNLRL